MASACALEWVPDSLYNLAVSAIVTSYSKYRRELKGLPENVQFDLYYKVKTTSQTLSVNILTDRLTLSLGGWSIIVYILIHWNVICLG